MTSIVMRRRRAIELEPRPFAARWVRSLWLVAAGVSLLAPVVAATADIVWAWLMAWQWLAIGWLGARLRAAPTAAVRWVVVMAWAYAAVMAGVLVGLPDAPDRAVYQHPAFGEHPVLVRAGLPWPGIEGNGQGLACDRIPFTMGIDALLVNTAFWLAVFAWLHRRTTAQRAAQMLWPATAVATVAGLVGAWRLIALFD
jgi:hypothetical protein